MAINVRKENQTEVQNPRPTHAKFFIGPDGQPRIKDSNGAVYGIGSLPVINWKNGTPGNPYVSGDVVLAQHNTIVMVQVATPNLLTIVLPAITGPSAAQRVAVRNLNDKKSLDSGQMVITPNPADAILSFATGQAVVFETEVQNFDLESDGVGRWNGASLGVGELLVDDLP